MNYDEKSKLFIHPQYGNVEYSEVMDMFDVEKTKNMSFGFPHLDRAWARVLSHEKQPCSKSKILLSGLEYYEIMRILSQWLGINTLGQYVDVILAMMFIIAKNIGFDLVSRTINSDPSLDTHRARTNVNNIVSFLIHTKIGSEQTRWLFMLGFDITTPQFMYYLQSCLICYDTALNNVSYYTFAAFENGLSISTIQQNKILLCYKQITDIPRIAYGTLHLADIQKQYMDKRTPCGFNKKGEKKRSVCSNCLVYIHIHQRYDDFLSQTSLFTLVLIQLKL